MKLATVYKTFPQIDLRVEEGDDGGVIPPKLFVNHISPFCIVMTQT